MKFKSFLAAHGALVKDIAISGSLLGASAGIVFGVSAGMFHIEYMNLEGGEARLYASTHNGYYSENISSGWNMNEVRDPVTGQITTHGLDMKTLLKGKQLPQHMTDFKEHWEPWHPGSKRAPFELNSNDRLELSTNEGQPINPNANDARFQFATMVIDGATHTTMDRSFNQSLYEGLVDFNKNIKCESYDSQNLDPKTKNTAMSLKPSQDNTTEFINTYMSIISGENNGVVGLAGFNHSTPLNALMFHNKGDDGAYTAYATANSPVAIEKTGKTGFVLLDANCANNQNVASVQFRADQPGFLAALAVCEYLYSNLDLYHNNYQDLSVAEFGGVSIPTVMIYMGGFQRGVELFNTSILQQTITPGEDYQDVPIALYFDNREPTDENLRLNRCYKTLINLIEHSKYKNEFNAIKDDTSLSLNEKVLKYKNEIYQKFYDEYSIKIIKLGDLSTHFTGTFAAGDAIGITKQYLNRGASAIIAVAGPQSLDAAQEIQNQNSKCIVIGVDTAMENGDYQRFHKGCSIDNKKVHNTNDPYMDKSVAEDGSTPTEANSIIKFSAVKDIKAVSNKIARLIAGGYNWDVNVTDSEGYEIPDPDRAICGPGFQTCCNIKNGLISISYDGFYPLVQALSHLSYMTWGPVTITGNFDVVWQNAALDYVDTLSDEEIAAAGDEYFPKNGKVYDPTKGVFNVKNLFTYKTTDEDGEPSTYYKNYNHTMAILGIVLDNAQLTFDKEMTLVPGKGGFVIPDQNPNLTILEWLDYNMYLMC